MRTDHYFAGSFPQRYLGNYWPTIAGPEPINPDGSGGGGSVSGRRRVRPQKIIIDLTKNRETPGRARKEEEEMIVILALLGVRL